MIFFLYGEDSYRSKEKVKLIKNRFLQKDSSNMNVVEIDAEKIQYGDLKAELSASPFLHDKKLIIINNFLSKNKQTKTSDELNELIKSKKIPASTFIIFWESKTPDKRKKLFKTLTQDSQVEIFDPLDSYRLTKWILDTVSQSGGKIDSQSVNLLAVVCGNDLWVLSNEIAKLLAYSSKITQENIKLLVAGKVNDNIFELTDAISKKDKKKAVILLNDQLKLSNNDVSYVLNMIIRQFRTLIMVASFVSDQGQSQSSMANSLGLHPFVASKASSQVSNFKMSELKNIYCNLLEIDVKLKQGSIFPEVFLNILISELI